MDKTGLISEQSCSEILNKLETAFNFHLSGKAFILYWQYLKDMPEERLAKEVDKIIMTEDKFPSIARLLKKDWKEK